LVIKLDIIFVWKLACLDIICNLVADGRICISKRLDCFILTPLLWEILFFLFQTQIQVYIQLKGHQVQVYLRNSNSKCLKSFLDNANKKPREWILNFRITMMQESATITLKCINNTNLLEEKMMSISTFSFLATFFFQ
jgi:hypothetical protein